MLREEMFASSNTDPMNSCLISSMRNPFQPSAPPGYHANHSVPLLVCFYKSSSSESLTDLLRSIASSNANRSVKLRGVALAWFLTKYAR